MKAEQIVTGRFKSIMPEVLTYHAKIEDLMASKAKITAKLVAEKDSTDSEYLKELAKEFVETAEMEVIIHNDYNQMLAIAKEVATLAKAVNPEIENELETTEKELLVFLESWDSLLCKAKNGKIEIKSETLKSNLENRKNDLTEEHVKTIIKNVSNPNI